MQAFCFGKSTLANELNLKYHIASTGGLTDDKCKFVQSWQKEVFHRMVYESRFDYHKMMKHGVCIPPWHALCTRGGILEIKCWSLHERRLSQHKGVARIKVGRTRYNCTICPWCVHALKQAGHWVDKGWAFKTWTAILRRDHWTPRISLSIVTKAVDTKFSSTICCRWCKIVVCWAFFLWFLSRTMVTCLHFRIMGFACYSRFSAFPRRPSASVSFEYLVLLAKYKCIVGPQSFW